MDLADTIINEERAYHVLGSFPVIGEIKEDGKMHDVITGKVIEESQTKTNGLSYHTKYKAATKMTEEMLTLIGEEEQARYREYLINLETYSKEVFFGQNKAKYAVLRLNNSDVNNYPVIAKVVNGELVDMITKSTITPVNALRTVTSKLSTNASAIREISGDTAKACIMEIIDTGVETYISNINEARKNSIRNYNNYTKLNRDYLKNIKR